MKVFGFVCLALWIVGAVLYAAADRTGDSFGAAVLAWAVIIAAVVCTLVLGAFAVGRHFA